ncbi:MAG TPA: DUF1315 family protein [Marinobacter sp.]|nr:DUF1315 family protein [Marinobacter sp.]
MTYDELIQKIDPTIYKNLRQSVQLGRWPDGRKLTAEQREISMQAVIYYENRNNVPEQERTGYIDRGSKAGTACDPSVQASKTGGNTGTDSSQFVEVKV